MATTLVSFYTDNISKEHNVGHIIEIIFYMQFWMSHNKYVSGPSLETITDFAAIIKSLP